MKKDSSNTVWLGHYSAQPKPTADLVGEELGRKLDEHEVPLTSDDASPGSPGNVFERAVRTLMAANSFARAAKRDGSGQENTKMGCQRLPPL